MHFKVGHIGARQRLMLTFSGGLAPTGGLGALGPGAWGGLKERRPPACCINARKANEPDDKGRLPLKSNMPSWARGDPLPEGRGAPAPAAPSPRRKRDRLLDWLRGRRFVEVGAQKQDAKAADAAGSLPLSVLAASAADTPLSLLLFDAIAALPSEQTFDGRIALRVGSDREWRVFVCKDGVITTDCLDPAVDILGAGCDAAVEWRDEQVFEAIMDERLSTAAAVALAKLRIRGSITTAAASEVLFEQAEVLLRNRFEGAVAMGGDALAAAEEARQAEVKREEVERLRRVSARSVAERFVFRHAGTDQQLGAVLLVVGGALYTLYCAAALQYPDPAQAETSTSDQLYLASSVLWLAGSFALVHGFVFPP